MDPSVLLKQRGVQWADPLDDYSKLRTLRDLMDQRRIREQQYQLQQQTMQEHARKAQYEQEDRQRAEQFRQAIGRGATLRDLAAIDPHLTAEWATKEATRETARLAQGSAQRKAQTEQQQQVADVLYGVRNVQGEGRQAAMDQAVMEDLMRPEAQRLGIGQIGQETPLAPTEQQWQQKYSAAYTPEKLQTVLKGETEAKAADLKFEEEQFKAAYPQMAGANDQESWTRAIKGLPIRLQPLMPPRFNAANKQKALSMWVPAANVLPETAGDWIRISVDPNASREEQEQADKALSKFATQGKASAPQMILSADQKVGNEAKLRDDYRQESKNYLTIRDAFGKVQGAAQSQTGPGDISLIFAYMKILDPGSTVREGEFATAQNAGSIPQRVQAMYNKAINGERLDPTIRNQFVEEAEKIYRQTEANQDKIRKTYGAIASRSNLDPENVVVDYSPGVVAPQAPKAKPSAPPAGAAPVVPLGDVLLKPGDVVNGYRYTGGDRKKKDSYQKVN
jgi:hypothetical protein